MSRRRKSSNPVSLFPFLAVLVSAMGALILLLLVVSRQAMRSRDAEQRFLSSDSALVELPPLPERLKFQPPDPNQYNLPDVVTHELKPLPELVDPRPMLVKEIESRRERLQRTRIESASTGNDVPDARLSELASQIDQIEQSLLQLREMRIAEGESQNKLKKELLELERRRATIARTNVFASEAYSIVPYDGTGGTNRQPVYMECRADRIILQPEGVVIRPSDLSEPGDPSNPLAQILRTILREKRAKGERPYPLLVVRPDGIASFYVARTAMDVATKDYGYELVEDETLLQFGEPDESRRLMAEQTLRSRSGGLGASPGERFALDLTPERSGRSGPPARGSLPEDAEAELKRRLGADAQGRIASGESRPPSRAVLGPPGTAPGQLPPAMDSSSRERAEPRVTLGQPLSPSGVRELASIPGSPSTGTDGESSPRDRALRRLSTPFDGESREPSTSRPSANQKSEMDSRSADQPKTPLKFASAKNSALGKAGEKGATAPMSALDEVLARMTGPVSEGASSEQLSGVPMPSSSAAPSSGGAPGDAKSSKDPAPPGTISLSRVRWIIVDCNRDEIILFPGRKVVSLVDDPTLERAKGVVLQHAAEQILSWGPPSESTRWRPVLEINVRPDGLSRYYDLRLALAGSGLEIRRKLIGWSDDLDFNDF